MERNAPRDFIEDRNDAEDALAERREARQRLIDGEYPCYDCSMSSGGICRGHQAMLDENDLGDLHEDGGEA